MMMPSRGCRKRRIAWARWAWLALFLLATALRLPGADWDGGIAAHPDERFLVDTAVATPLWGDPTRAAPDFPYGHLPLVVLRLLVLAAPRADPLYAGRLLSGLLGILLVAAAGAFGRRLAGMRGGFLAAVLMVFAPFALQQARFFTVDILGAVGFSMALLMVLRRRFCMAGIFWGLAVACKVSLLWVGLPLLGAVFIGPLSPHGKHGAAPVHDLKYRALRLVALLLPAFLSFALVSPWALLRPVAAWRGPWIQSLMVVGRLDFPYTRQYAATLPFLYPLVQMGLWGLGPIATFVGLGGLLEAAFRWRRIGPRAQIAWMGATACFVALAGWYVKFPRYLFPLYPLWIAWGAWWLEQSARRAKQQAADFALWWGAAVLVVLPTILLGVAQLSIYAHPHPWEQASRWIYAEIPEAERVAVEHWDHPLPVSLPEGSADRYIQFLLPVMDEDTPEKLAQLQDALQASDVVVLASARGYGALARQPLRYAATLDWYRHLLREREIIAFGRCPRLGPLALTDDPLVDAGLPAPVNLAERCGVPFALRLPHLDESFRVYDAPVVLLAVRVP